MSQHKNFAIFFKHTARLLKISTFILTLASCASQKKGPDVYFSNASSEPISDIRCDWARRNTLTLPKLNPGDRRTQSFYINSYSDFFGTIVVTWFNSRGEKLSEEFNFRERHLPSIEDETTYNYVQLYFYQDGVSVLSSDAPNLPGETKRMDNLLKRYHASFATKNQTTDQALIRVEPQKDNSVPVWLTTSY